MNGSARTPDVVCLSSIDWDFLWQGHQQIMSSLAQKGTRVLFVENSGVRAPRPRDLPRVLRRLRRWWAGRAAGGVRDLGPRLSVLAPLLVPLPYSPGAVRLNQALLAAAVRRWMGPAAPAPVLWTFLPTPLALALRQSLRPRLTIYYCIDDLASSSAGARPVAASEEAMLGAADLVFVTSRMLGERARRFARRVHTFPFGVDFSAFERARETAVEPPSALRGLTRPVVGYVGGLHRWVDQDLLADVGARLPDFSFVLLGPAQCDVSTLERCPNIKLLGPRPHSDVPLYLRHLDAGIVPYVKCRYTDHVYPTKLNEYLAMGLPVVATPIPELQALDAEEPGLLALADSPEAFAQALRSAVLGDRAGARERRITVARENGWDARIGRMCDLIDHELSHGPAAGNMIRSSGPGSGH